MREFTPGPEHTITASGAVTDMRAVGFDGAQISTAGAPMLGVARGGYSDGELVRVVASGACSAESGGSFSQGDPLTTDANGRFVKAGDLSIDSGATAVQSTAADGSTIFSGGALPETVVAYALEDATGAGEFPRIFIR